MLSHRAGKRAQPCYPRGMTRRQAQAIFAGLWGPQSLRGEACRRLHFEAWQSVAQAIRRTGAHQIEREAYVMRRRDEGATLQAIGHELGVTRERVRQLEARAYRRRSATMVAEWNAAHPLSKRPAQTQNESPFERANGS